MKKDDKIVATVFVAAECNNRKEPLEEKIKKEIALLQKTRFGKTKFAICGSPSNFDGSRGIISIISKDESQCRLMKDLQPISKKAWQLLYQRNRDLVGANMRTLHESDGGGPLVVSEGEHLFSCIKNIAKILRYQEHALIASDAVLISAALAVALNDWEIEINLQPGEIVAFHFQLGNGNKIEFYSWEHITLPHIQ